MQRAAFSLLIGFTIFAITLAASPAVSPPESESQGVQSWTGKLVDADCKAMDASKACEVNGSTKSFALDTGGQTVRIDSNGNSKVMAKLRKTGKPAGSVSAEITGTLEHGEIQIQSIEIR
jgi:hypothetical protein